LSQSHKDRIKWPNVDEPNEEPETSEENSSAENSNSVMALREARVGSVTQALIFIGFYHQLILFSASLFVPVDPQKSEA